MCIKFSEVNILKFCCYDLNHSLPGQARSFCFPSIHHFLTHTVISWSLLTEFSSACNWKQTSQSTSLKHLMHFLWLQLFCIGWNHDSEFLKFYLLLKKKTKDSHLQKYSIDAFSSLCLYKIIEINQPMNSNCFHSQENSKKSLTHLLDKQ